MYVSPNFPTKKKLKEAVARWNNRNMARVIVIGAGEPVEHVFDAIKELHTEPKPVTVFAPGLGEPPQNGSCCVEGPHAPKPHSWYAEVEIRDGVVVKVR